MMNQAVKPLHLVSMLLMVLLFSSCFGTGKLVDKSHMDGVVVYHIKPSDTDKTIKEADEEHFVEYKPSNKEKKLLVYLGDTEERPLKGPMEFFDVAVDEGYKVINLSYRTRESVVKVCRSVKLSDDSHCTEKLRTKRIYGIQTTDLINDDPQDAIVNRLVKLLLYLKKNDAAGKWDAFLIGALPNWELITIAGQSQGGGMAEFIAKREKVGRVISFSGATDNSKTGKIAQWYYGASATPYDRYYAVYHTEELKADHLKSSYSVMEVPPDHTFVLDQKVRKPKVPEYQGVRNSAYKETWKKLLKG